MSPESSTPPNPARPRVLCVDDETAIREFLALYLRRKDFAVETAPDGLSALERFTPDANAFDLVITDNQMPRLNGLGFIRAIREAGYQGKIVIFSSMLGEKDAAVVEGLAVDAIIEKGMPVERLLTEVQNLFPS